MGKWFLGLALGVLGCSGSGGTDGALAGGGNTGAEAGASNAGSGNAGTSSSSGAASGGAANGGAANGGAANGGAANGGASDTFTSTLITAPAQTRGYLDIQQFSADKVSFNFNIDLSFGYTRGDWDGCTRNQLGECWYYDCPAGSNPVGANNQTPIYYDGGTATITGIPPAITIPFGGDGEYLGRGSTQLWPLAGGTVTLSFSGDDNVPAFTLPIPAPPMVWLTSINGEAAPSSLTRSDGMKLVWTSGGAGNVTFFVYELTGTRPAAACQFDAAANAGELPATVLGKLDPGTAYYLEFRGDGRADLMTGTFDMSAYADAYGYDFTTHMTTAVELK